MLPTRRKLLLIIALVLALWAAASTAFYFGWIHGADHRDLYPWWAAARLHLFQGLDPYAPSTTRQMQTLLYGHPIPQGMDQQAFHYPSQLMALLFPLWLINNVEIAAAIWEGLSLLFLLGALMLINRIRGQPLPVWVSAALLLWYYPLLMLFQAQTAGMVLAALLLGYWACQQQKDILAGVAMTIAVVKPELVFVPYLAVVFIAVRNKRWMLLVSFAAAQAVLFALSLVVAGWWVPGWLGAISRYGGYAANTWAPRTLWEISPLLLLVAAAGTFWCVSQVRRDPTLLFAASIPLGLMVLPQTLIFNLTLSIAPLGLAWRGKARWIIVLAWTAGWALLPFPRSWQLQYALIPSLALLALAIEQNKRIN